MRSPVHPNGPSTRSDPRDLVPLGSPPVMTSGVERKARHLPRAWVILAATAALLSSGLSVVRAQPAHAVTTFTGAFFDSEAGEYIGQGQTHSFTTVTSNFATNTHAYFNVATGGDQFFVCFTPPIGQKLAPGTYENVQRFPTATAGLDIQGDGRGCNEV